MPFMLGLMSTINAPVSYLTGYNYPYPLDIYCGYFASSGGVFALDSYAQTMVFNSYPGTFTNTNSSSSASVNHFCSSAGLVTTTALPNFPANNFGHKSWSADGTPATIVVNTIGQYASVTAGVNQVNLAGSSGFYSAAAVTVNAGIVGASLPAAGDSFSGSYFSSPLYIYSSTSGKSAEIGQIADITVSAQTLTANSSNGQTPSSVWLGQSGLVGGAWLPGGVSVLM